MKGLQSGGTGLGKLLPALSAAASARITTTAAAPAAGPEVASASNSLEKEFMVYRWHPEDGGKPHYQSYKVDLNECDSRDATSDVISDLACECRLLCVSFGRLRIGVLPVHPSLPGMHADDFLCFRSLCWPSALSAASQTSTQPARLVAEAPIFITLVALAGVWSRYVACICCT